MPVETGAADDVEVRSLRALVVDDNHDAADLLAALQQSRGHQVRGAYHGDEALDAFGTSELDLALIDLAMPGMDGYEVARRVRQNSQLNHVCLVAVTGFGQDRARERSLAAGFDYHLVKPIAQDALREVIGRCNGHQDPVDTNLRS